MSNHIYTEKTHYVYQITEISSAKKYIGVRTCKGEPKDDLGVVYFSSSTDKDFIKNQKTNHNNYKYEILNIHSCRQDAIDDEIKLHELYDVGNNPNFFNKSKQTSSGFDTSGCTVAIDNCGNRILVPINDPRLLTKELIHISTGNIIVKDNSGNKYVIKNNDERLQSGNFFGISKGKITVKDENGNILQVDVDDPRYKDGTYKSISHGMIAAKTKCGEIIYVCNDDPRFNVDELSYMNTNKVSVKDHNGETLQIDADDPRFLSGELVGVNKGKVTVKNSNGVTFQVDNNDPRFLSGELIHVSKGNIHITNGILTKQQDEKLTIPDGWWKGQHHKRIGRKGSLCPSSKKCSIEGVLYVSIIDAVRSLNLSRTTINNRMKSNKYPDWKFI